jgi:hypothetical protein
MHQTWREPIARCTGGALGLGYRSCCPSVSVQFRSFLLMVVRDSRGLAFAVTGDQMRVIEDFGSFVDWTARIGRDRNAVWNADRTVELEGAETHSQKGTI